MDSRSTVTGVAVVGIGRIGKVHCSNILGLPRVKLLYIIDVYKKAAEEYIQQFDLRATALHTDEIEKAYNDGRVHAIIVCCPTDMHEAHVKNALKHGKAVMCEKPLSFSLQAIVDCYHMAEEKEKPLFCAFNRRFDPQTASIHSRIPDVVGELKVVKTVSRDHPRNSIEYLRISGGIVLDSCIHDINMLLWMSRQIPDTIYAIGHAHFDDVREINDVDQLFVTMKFPDGVMGHIDLCRDATFGHDQRLEVFGSKGMLVGQNARPRSYQIHSVTGQSLPPIYPDCMTRYNDSYLREMKHFISAVRGETALSVTGWDTISTTLCCHATNESLKTGLPINTKSFVEKNYPDLVHVLGK